MADKLSYFLLLYMRLLGVFLLSPFFSSRIGFTLRVCLAFACSLVLAPPLLNLHKEVLVLTYPFFLLLIKELLIGYLIGFFFSLLFEAASFAGEVLGALGGFSAGELFGVPRAHNLLFSGFFSLLIMVLFLALDLHHVVLKLLFETFTLVSPSSFSLQEGAIFSLLQAVGKLFSYALSYALYPMTLLICLNILLAFFSKDIMIFLNGFPAQILIALSAIAFSLFSFDKILIENFYDLLNTVKRLLFAL